MAHKSSRTNFDNVLQMVKDDPKVVFGRYARMLSDLSAEKAAKLGAVLEGLTPERRAAFYQGMKETHHESFEYDFSPVAKIGLADADGEIRADYYFSDYQKTVEKWFKNLSVRMEVDNPNMIYAFGESEDGTFIILSFERVEETGRFVVRIHAYTTDEECMVGQGGDFEKTK